MKKSIWQSNSWWICSSNHVWSCFWIFKKKFEFFEKISISTISGWVGCWRKKKFCQALFHASDEVSLTEASCKISTKSDNYFKSYAIFSIFFLVGLLVCLDYSTFFKTHQNISERPFWSMYQPNKILLGLLK